jgi:magnesium chelatase family protein
VVELSRTPPFEAPHHSASVAALVGGGTRFIRPGAIARASEGVLFLDEAGEFASSALDALRQPLESGSITIHRAGAQAQYPARFQLVLATNPCPCGDYGIRGGTCTCPPAAIRRYLGRLSGPLLDRMDIELTLTRVSVAQRDKGPSISTAAARDRVADARDRARHRLAGTPWRVNADVPGSWLREGPGAPAPVVRRPLDAALHRGALTLRGYDRVLRVAWSIADIEGRAQLSAEHIGRALYLKKGLAL